MPTTYLRQWTVQRYFGSVERMYAPPEATESEVRLHIEQTMRSDSVRMDTLERGSKVKAKKARERSIIDTSAPVFEFARLIDGKAERGDIVTLTADQAAEFGLRDGTKMLGVTIEVHG